MDFEPELIFRKPAIAADLGRVAAWCRHIHRNSNDQNGQLCPELSGVCDIAQRTFEIFSGHGGVRGPPVGSCATVRDRGVPEERSCQGQVAR